MKPGATTRPPASIRSRAAWPSAPATSTIVPFFTATLPWREGPPVPSTMRALSITRSCMSLSSELRRDGARGRFDVRGELLEARLHPIRGAADRARADDAAVAIVHGHRDTGRPFDDLVDAHADAGGADLVERRAQCRQRRDRAVRVALERERADDRFALAGREERE